MMEKIELTGDRDITLDDLEVFCTHARDVGAQDDASILPWGSLQGQGISCTYRLEDR
jgi:hypothetical protein